MFVQEAECQSEGCAAARSAVTGLPSRSADFNLCVNTNEMMSEPSSPWFLPAVVRNAV